MITWRNTGLAFAAMPKTGGSWVAKVISTMPGQDYARQSDGLHAHDLDRLWLHRGNGCHVFTVIRKPSDWLPSLWAYSHRSPLVQPPGGPCGIFTPAIHSSWQRFQDWVLDHPRIVDMVYEAYVASSDTVLRQENLADDLVRMLEVLGIAHDPEHIKSFPRINEASHPKPCMSQEAVYKLHTNNQTAYVSWRFA